MGGGRRPKRMRGERVSLPEALANTCDAVVLTEPRPPYNITCVAGFRDPGTL